ncbi:MAG: ATP-binding protein [Bacteroidales bacterium]
MSLKTKYFIYFTIIHLIFTFITIVIYHYNKVLFVVCEGVIVLSLLLFIRFYHTIFHPFRLLNAGVEAISDKDFSMKILPVGQPELDKLTNVFNKMIEQLRLERTLTTEKNFFLEKLIEASPAAIIILDKEQQVRTINPAGYNLLKFSSKKDETLSISEFPSPWNVELSQLTNTGSFVIQINGINQFKCSKSYFIDRGVKQTFFLIEELTKEIWDAERQSYEKVIRMMSHEVNNSVGAVNSIIESSINYMDEKDNDAHSDFSGALRIARERMDNLNKFTKRFADIVHIPPPKFAPCNLTEMLSHVMIFFQAELNKKNIKVTNRYKSSAFTVSFDAQQLELVLVNIIKNAIQAIQSEGTINIELAEGPPTLIVENNGEPIPYRIQKRLFEPFFTTKKTGQGIGLTLIREILTNHKCDFSLITRDDGITEFKIIFNPI